MNSIGGKVFKYGDNIDTDLIYPGRYCHLTKEEDMKKYCLVDLDESFVNRVQEGDIIIAGYNFGCGSSREIAPLSIKTCGVSCIIAKSFARIFFRNAINIGLAVFEMKDIQETTEQGDEIELNLEKGILKNITRSTQFKLPDIPEFLRCIIGKGGLMNYIIAEMKENG